VPRIKHRIEKDLTLMEKLQLPPRETAFILITSDKERHRFWARAAPVIEPFI
jgi:hypothetical protein